MDKTLAGAIAVAQFSWNTTAFIVSSVSSTVVFPFKLIAYFIWWTTSPPRLVIAFLWTAFTNVVTFLFDEFEALIIFLAVAVSIGFLGGIISRLVSSGVSYIFDPIPIKEAECGSRPSSRGPGSLESDFSYSEDDPLPPHRHLTGTGKPRPAPGSLFEQTIHEELEDSSS